MKGDILPKSANAERTEQLERRVYALTSDLQAARDTIARYEAMIWDADEITFEDGGYMRRGAIRWRWRVGDGPMSRFPALTALDAYDALKEATT